MKEFIYTIERVNADDPRLDEYQRGQVKDWYRWWAVSVNGQPCYLHAYEAQAIEAAKHLTSRKIAGQVRKLVMS